MPKFIVSGEKRVRVAVKEECANVSITVNGIKVAFFSAGTGRLARYYLSVDEILVLQKAGIAIKGDCVEIA